MRSSSTHLEYMSNMAGVLWEARAAYPSQAHVFTPGWEARAADPSQACVFTPGFWWGLCCSSFYFSVFCGGFIVFFFVCNHHVSPVPNVTSVSGLSITFIYKTHRCILII